MKKFNNFFGNVIFCTKVFFEKSFFQILIKIFNAIILPIISVVMSYILKYIIDDLTESNEDFNIILIMLGVYFILKAFITLFSNIDTYGNEIANNKLKKYVDNIIIKQCNNLDISIYDDPKCYNEISYIQGNYSSILNLVEGTIEVISSIVSSLFILIYSFKNIRMYAIFIVASCIPAAISKIKYTNDIFRMSIFQMNDERKIDYIMSLVMDKKYSQDMKHNSIFMYLNKKYVKIWSDLLSEKKRILKKGLSYSSISLFIPEVTCFFVMWSISKKIYVGKSTIGDFSLYMGLINQLWGYVNRIIFSFDNIVAHNSKIKYLRQFINKKSHLENGQFHLDSLKSIKFENVSFKYPFSDEYTLKNVSFMIEENRNVIFVGENGSGKSTIIKLILRFYDATEGNIYINNKNIKDYNIDEIRKLMGVYFQNSDNYAFKIKDNIMIPNEEDDIDTKVLTISGFDKSMEKNNINLDTYVGKLFQDDGVELSVGEHQRLALCRALYSNKDWLIFDEPSSAMDPKIEFEFYDQLRSAFKDKTLIYISHRLNMISKSEYILVMDKGELVEEGKFENLMNSKGVFYNLYALQNDL